MNTKGNCQTINEIGTNPTTDTRCTYGFTGGTGITFNQWLLETPFNAIPVNSYGAPDYSQINNVILPVVWKNVEASAYPDSSILKVKYNGIQYVTKPCGPFILTFNPITFVGGSSKNIPCYSTGTVTIALNSYVNTINNGYDKGEWITRHFEWTLPSGWQTTTGQSGTFVSSSSINVIPPASSASVSISVRAKANTQYSSAATLQITRNLESFTISGPTSVYYNSNYRYTAPSITGVNYTWQLPAGWTGQSTGSYIDVVAGCSTGNISCTMTACNQTKTKTITLPITSNVINPATTISGPFIVCSSGATFTISNLPPVESIEWIPGPYLTISSGQNTASCTFSATGYGSSWVTARVVTDCGSITLPQKPVWAGGPQTPVISGPAHMHCGDQYTFSVPVQSSEAGTTYFWDSNVFEIEDSNLPTCKVSGYFNHNHKLFCTVTACGVSKTVEKTINVNSCDLLLFSPNPADDQTIVSLESGAQENEIIAGGWDMEVYDPSQLLKVKKIKLKDRTTTLNTAGWKDGVYTVRAIIGNNIVSEKLVVKH